MENLEEEKWKTLRFQTERHEKIVWGMKKPKGLGWENTISFSHESIYSFLP